MKRIYEQFNCAYNAANLTAKIIAKNGENENAVELLQENILRATFERPNVSGAESIEYDEDAEYKRSAYTIYEEDGFYYLDAYFKRLTIGMHRVVFVMQYGTNAKIKLVYDINVTATAEGVQGLTPNDIAISEQAEVEVTTIAGESGAITLGDGLQMVDKELSVAGGDVFKIFDLGNIASVPQNKDITSLIDGDILIAINDYLIYLVEQEDIVSFSNIKLKLSVAAASNYVLTFSGGYYGQGDFYNALFECHDYNGDVIATLTMQS